MSRQTDQSALLTWVTGVAGSFPSDPKTKIRVRCWGERCRLGSQLQRGEMEVKELDKSSAEV